MCTYRYQLGHCVCFCHPSGSEEDLFYDAPSSPISEQAFFSDNPMPLRYGDLHKRKSLFKEDAPKNMTDLVMTFEITEVQRVPVELGDSQSVILVLSYSNPLFPFPLFMLSSSVSSLFIKFSVQLCRLSGDEEIPVLHLDIEGLGTELKLRTFDMTSNTYLREICLKCPEYMGQ